MDGGSVLARWLEVLRLELVKSWPCVWSTLSNVMLGPSMVAQVDD